MQGLTTADLIHHFQEGCKPQADWRIGTEHEKLIYNQKTLRRIPYEGGIASIFKELESFDWKPVIEKDHAIALSKDKAAITLEPGGQLELAGAPLADVHQTTEEIKKHLADIEKILRQLDFQMVMMGYDPKWMREDIPWMPKGRYDVMRPYMLKKGQHGQDMMTATCTVQVNLDFSSEQDMIKKMRVAMALQPIAIALFSNSPFTAGQPNGFESYRSWVWQDTDPDRCGLLPFVFKEEMGFERYVDYALDVPMYFVYRQGRYIDVAGQSFKDFMKGNLPGFPHEKPTLKDWENHLTTLFPEVRLKKYLELRGADCVPPPYLYALPAFWTGLLYDPDTLQHAHSMVKEWSFDEINAVYKTVSRQGLNAKFQGSSLHKIAQDLLSLSEKGLQRRARLNSLGQDESIYLACLHKLLDSGESLSQKHLKNFKTLYREGIDAFLRSLFSE